MEQRLPRWLRALWPWLAAAASGALLVLAFPAWNQAWLAWIALVPLIAAVWSGVPAQKDALVLEKNRRRVFLRSPDLRAAALGYVAGLVFFWSVFSWLTTVTAPGLIALGPYMAFYFAFWTWLLARLLRLFGQRFGQETELRPPTIPSATAARRPKNYAPPEPPRGMLLGSLFSFRGLGGGPATRHWVLRSRWNLALAALGASAWVAQEWVRSWLFSGWGWNSLGAALHDNTPLIQLAQWTGVGGLSFLVAFVNVIAAVTVRRFALELRHRRVRPHFDFTLTLAALLTIFAAGFAQLRPFGPAAAEGETTLRVACVQAAIPQNQKWDPEFQQRIFDTYKELTEVALAYRPQLLVWPEAATPQPFLNERANFDFVMNFAGRGGFNFLLGTIDQDFDADTAGTPPSQTSAHDFNAAVLLTPGAADPPQVYRKLHLVPFGEFVPFRKSFPLFAWVVGDQVPSDFEPGAEPQVFELRAPALRVAPLICFEDTVATLVRRFVVRQPDGGAGAQVLVDLTNDAWFERTAASRQHVAEAVFRCVETRRPMVRCANTGVTCVIDRFGRVRQILRTDSDGTFGRGVMFAEIEVPRVDAPLPFFARHGEVFAQSCAGIAVAALCATFFLRRKHE